MSHAACLLRLVAPRTATPLPEALAALAATLPAADGTALEMVGEEGALAFFVRGGSPATRDQAQVQMRGYYPQALVLPVEGGADDPLRPRVEEEVSQGELLVREDTALPIAPEYRPETVLGDDPLQAVLAVLRGAPPGIRLVSQLTLWPAPHGWARGVRDRARRAQERSRRDDGHSGLSLPAVGVLVGLGLLALCLVRLWRHDDPRSLALPALGALASLAIALLIGRLERRPPVEDMRLFEAKLSAPPCAARLRLLAFGGTADARDAALAALAHGYGVYDFPGGNGFVMRPAPATDPCNLSQTHGWRARRMVLNARGVAALWHLPAPELEVPGLERTGSRVLLPAHPSLGSGLPIGQAQSRTGETVPVCLPDGALGAHMLVTGSTGAGKSTILHVVVRALVDGATGLVLVDPHGDLADAVLGALDPLSARRVVVLRLADRERAVGLNLLDAHVGRAPAQIVSGLLAAFEAIWGTAWGPRMELPLRMALLTILHANAGRRPDEQLTILDVVPLLLNRTLRADILRAVDDPHLDAYWHDQYDEMTKSFREQVIAPVLSKFDRFIASDTIHAIVGQSETTLPLRRLLDERRPLIIDTAMSGIGAENAALLGAVLLGMVADYAKERPARDRLLVVVDEFQTVPAPWDDWLSGLRKFGVRFVLATQESASLERVREGLRGVVLNNKGTLIAFRAADPDDARYLARALVGPIEEEDLLTLPARHCYLTTTDGAEQLPAVRVRVDPPPATRRGSRLYIDEASARQYGRPVADVLAARADWTRMLRGEPRQDLFSTPAPAPAEDGSFPPGSATPSHGLGVVRGQAYRTAPRGRDETSRSTARPTRTARRRGTQTPGPVPDPLGERP